jgi:hypothetical protein
MDERRGGGQSQYRRRPRITPPHGRSHIDTAQPNDSVLLLQTDDKRPSPFVNDTARWLAQSRSPLPVGTILDRSLPNTRDITDERRAASCARVEHIDAVQSHGKQSRAIPRQSQSADGIILTEFLRLAGGQVEGVHFAAAQPDIQTESANGIGIGIADGW